MHSHAVDTDNNNIYLFVDLFFQGGLDLIVGFSAWILFFINCHLLFVYNAHKNRHIFIRYAYFLFKEPSREEYSMLLENFISIMWQFLVLWGLNLVLKWTSSNLLYSHLSSQSNPPSKFQQKYNPLILGFHPLANKNGSIIIGKSFSSLILKK